jgi:hypothetical protein
MVRTGGWRRVPGLWALAALLLLLAAGLVPGRVAAAACNVTNDATLRAALADVNCDPINITVPGTLTLDGPPGSITELYIGRSVTVTNTSGGAVTLAGGPGQRSVLMTGPFTVVAINGGASGLTISGGDSTPGAHFGGGIFNQGSLALTNVAVRDNTTGSGDGLGGGIFNLRGSLTLTNSSVIDNAVTTNPTLVGLGGGIFNDSGTVILNGSRIAGNDAVHGGGIYSTEFSGPASVTLIDSTVNDNTAGIGGGVFNFAGNGSAATFAMTGGSISGNTATGDAVGSCHGGGGLSNWESNGTATAMLTGVLVSGNAANSSFSSGGGLANCDGALTLHGGVVSKNRAINAGGGIYNRRGMTTITGTTIGGPLPADGNTAVNGAGIFNIEGSLELVESTVRGNTAAGEGGGIANIAQTTGFVASASLARTTVSENSAGSGGAINHAAGMGSAVLSVIDSTINGNSSQFGTAGIRNQGLGATTVTATITNSTLAGNSGDNGALMVIADSGITNVTATLTNVTIADNTATTAGYGAGLQIRDRAAAGGTASVTLRNSIIANSTGPNIALIGPGAALTSGGHNISDDTSDAATLTGPGDLNGVPAGLDPAGLASNGGPTRTIALLATSPAIDRVPTSGAHCPATDQRGIARPQAVACDSGAFESNRLATALAVAPAGGVYGGTVGLAATLTRGGTPVAGQPIAFTLNGTPVGTATTNASGLATLASASLGTIPAGGYPVGVGASFAGSGPYLPSSGTAALTVAKAGTTTTAQNATATYGDAGVTLTTTVVANAPSAAPVNEGAVTFVVKKGAQTVCTATSGTVSNGNASATCALGGANAGSYTVTATYSGGPNVNGSSDTATLQVKRRILWVKPVDRTVGLHQPNPPTTPPAGCLAAQTPTSACWLELATGSSFAPGDDWFDLNLSVLRFQYERNPPSTNSIEYVGKTYRMTAFGVTSANYEIRYKPGTMTVGP